MPETPPPAAAGTQTTQPAGPIPAAEPAHPAGAGPPALVPSFGRPPGRRPLPDAVAVRRLVVPQSAPPYDDEPRPAGRKPGRPAPAEPAQAAEPGRDGEPGRPAGPAPGGAAEAGWPGQFAQVLAETLAGSRSPRQITPWTTEQARRHIRQLGPMLSGAQRPRLRRVLTSCPAADVVEMTAIVTFGPRVRALAVRLELDGPQGARPGRGARPARWLCTAVEAA